MKKSLLFTLSIVLSCSMNLYAQEEDSKQEDGYVFNVIKEVPTTSIKNQYRSGTCWSFSTLSFVESEILRMGKGDYDLSEMYVVYKIYSDKAKKYVRTHGSLNFGGGGALNDPIDVIEKYGMVPRRSLLRIKHW